MQAEDKRSQIKSWFMPEPKLQWGLLIIALLFLLCGIVIDASTVRLILVGVSAIVGGLAYYMYTKAKARYDARPSTDQMTQWLEEDLETLKEKSLEKFTLDDSETIAESIILKGPIWWATPGLDDMEVQRGKANEDGYLYSCWEIVVLHIAEDSLAAYGCVYNWLRNHSTNETTVEYFYEDIVSISTGNESITQPLLDTDKKLGRPGCVLPGCGCLGYLNPFFYVSLFLDAVILSLRGAFGDSFDLELPDPLKLKREDGELVVEGKMFKITLRGGDPIAYLIDSQQLEIYGAKETAEHGDRTVTALSRRLRDKKADKNAS